VSKRLSAFNIPPLAGFFLPVLHNFFTNRPEDDDVCFRRWQRSKTRHFYYQHYRLFLISPFHKGLLINAQ